MAKSYGQLAESKGQKVTYAEFEKEVASRLRGYVLLKLTRKHIKLCKRLYNQGYTIADAADMIMLNS